MKQRGKIIFTVVFLLSILLMAVSYEKILLAVGNFLIIQDDLHPADVIHVIAGDDYRTNYAIELYKQGKAQYIFFTGGWCKIHGYLHGEHGEQIALSQGVPLKAIAFDDSVVTSTYSETVKLKAWMDQSPVPIRSVIVVSDPFHMRRARWTYRRVLGKDAEIMMAPIPFEETPYQEKWWLDYSSRKYVKDEYLKYIYYIARYQLSWGFIKEKLASLDRD